MPALRLGRDDHIPRHRIPQWTHHNRRQRVAVREAIVAFLGDQPTERDGEFRFSVSDDTELDEIYLPPGWVAEFTGSSNTGADGYTTVDVAVVRMTR